MTGLLVCRVGFCPIGTSDTKAVTYYNSLPTWDEAKGNGFTSWYRATPEKWLVGNQEKEKLSFVLGNEECDLVDQNRFYNGPLLVDHTYRVWEFACTSVGCTEGDHIELSLTTQKGTGRPVYIIAAVVCCALVLIVICIVVIVYVKIIKPRSSNRRSTTYTSTDSTQHQNEDTYEEISVGQELKEIQDGGRHTEYYNTKESVLESKDTYDQLAPYLNVNHHEYGKIIVE